MICVSLGITDFHDAIKLAKELQMLELRADLLNWSGDEYSRIIDIVPYSVFTLRPTEKSDDERLELYRFAIENKVNFIDVELEACDNFIGEIKKIIKNRDTELILSYHNYHITPDTKELNKILKQCYLFGADVAKIACMSKSYADAARLLSLYQEGGRKVVIGMGESGKIVRVASLLLGAEFTFAASGTETVTAPGQLTWSEMKDIYKILGTNL